MLLKEIKKKATMPSNGFPFQLPVIKEFKSIGLQKPVTIFVGDNGSGKSTLLEAIAYQSNHILVSGETMDIDDTFDAARKLAPHLQLSWSFKSKDGFFFRSEDFTSFMKKTRETRQDLEKDYREIKARDPNSLEALPYARNLGELKNLYGDGLEYQSHGESFLSLFQARMKGKGLYVLDEPETPLSPLKQLSLISLIKEMVEQGSQFIIATHSPMIMAMPNAAIYQIVEGSMEEVAFEEVEHVRVMKDFLDAPERFIKHL
ncbi:heme ABC transporter ATP-binding protein CcmA [Halalkalibacillus sediminis]|uniref:Heme ABC transporter ATP-binding protein CcmA n=1 Tax=Halalkalibacillus sediminis TaxID=2018042 RepID=A0A2I0QVK0_9BACI|nr:AAA family ATPase [Halalkalibacillus sediminis]PKR78371.1 heme ABC transporter ATP-binding protein CcmA [Halalkalibacillus sediminis]